MTPQIFVPIHTYPDGNSERLGHHAAAVARHLHGEVRALVLNGDFPRVSSALGNILIDVPAMIAEAKAKCQERGATLVRAMESVMASHGIAFSAAEAECLPALVGDTISYNARYYDLTLIGLRTDDATLRASAEAAVFCSGRPTLLVPEEAPVASIGHVMLAWDGSRVAARAVADAREFLARARSVTIASVVDEKELPDSSGLSRLADHLSRHELRAEVVRLESRGRPIAETLQGAARERGAGLLVMGGFGHSRMRDFVLGGATQGVLASLKMPVMLSH
ncbi:MAG: universal stress protein [Alphaproteobacteria bacterium]